MSLIRPAALAALLALASCGDSSLNPLRWFSGGGPERVQLYPDGGFAAPRDGRQRIESVTALSSAPVVGGIVVTATGLPPRQGYWDGALVSPTDFVPDDKGVLALDFRIAPPPGPTDVNRPQSREVVVGLFISRQKLAGVREILVQGKANSRGLRR